MNVVTEILDLRENPCPGNWPKILISLETLDRGDVLEVILDDIVALDRIPEMLKEETDYKLIDSQVVNANIHLFIKVF
ncbi:MAG TPA: sulfurtransferase TusA family protein [Bacteroidales bacterium]|nr:sulfurtransferase TusA family protein [Bacteroidales bacterium]HOL96967.1 sulfurtransferase TusA family protein [Bacteroidales bacterium]HOM36480.1 sulfurtransferase TusA family protein [Bacteroidales bacterium]HPD23991.1 sulfurtransferase TusA family protein [Bacteroidales bacterium]HRS98524.1 sulfurtransferase TusA family protein [Bacteroidales bacterium]